MVLNTTASSCRMGAQFASALKGALKVGERLLALVTREPVVAKSKLAHRLVGVIIEVVIQFAPGGGRRIKRDTQTQRRV
jgi:hypothetical protein